MQTNETMIPPKMVAEFDRAAGRSLRALAGRLRLYLLVTGLGALLPLVVALAGGQLIIDWTFRLPTDMRAALSAAMFLAAALATWRWLVRPVAVSMPQDQMALIVERRFPQLRDRLISAVQFARMTECEATASAGPARDRPVDWGDGRARSLMCAVIRQAQQDLKHLDLGNALNHRRAVRRSGMTLGTLAIVGAAMIIAPATMRTWFRRNVLLADDAWPQRTRLILENLRDGVLRHPRGDELDVIVSVADGYTVPREVSLEYEYESGREGTEQMASVGQRQFVARFPPVNEPLALRASGGDDQTDWVQVRLVDRPRITQATVRVAPPRYARVEPYALPAGRTVVELLLGSRMTIDFKTNKPVAKAVLRDDRSRRQSDAGPPTTQRATATRPEHDPAEGLMRIADRQWRATIEPPGSAVYFFDLADEQGLHNSRPARFSVRVRADQAPRVQMKLPGVGEMVVPEAVIPVDTEFTDRFGLASARLVYETGAESPTPRQVELSDFRPNVKRFSTHLDWPLSSLAIQPGDRLTLFAEATDFDDVSGPNVGRSTTAVLRVVTREELLAELARREQEHREEFERIIRDQEKLRGDLLTVLDRAAGQDMTVEQKRELADSERQQRLLANRADAVRMHFEQILAEMEMNQLANVVVRQRIGQGVVEALGHLVKRQVPEAADRLDRFRKDQSQRDRDQIDPDQVALLEAMRAVLAHIC